MFGLTKRGVLGMFDGKCKRCGKTVMEHQADMRCPDGALSGPQPFAWVHTVKQHGGDDSEDQALSFKPDNFPLQGEAHGMFYSVGQPRPLYLHPPADGVGGKTE